MIKGAEMINVRPYQASGPRAPEMHVLEHAGHYDFLTPRSEPLARAAPAICVSEPDFDWVAFHRNFNTEAVRFFEQSLHPR